MAKHNQIGRKGEDIASTYLLSKGYEVLEKNYRYKRAEIDIIARIGNDIAFVEVKTRTGEQFGYPEEAVAVVKKKKMKEAAENYLIENPSNLEPRFDIISISLKGTKQEIQHIEDAFFFE